MPEEESLNFCTTLLQSQINIIAVTRVESFKTLDKPGFHETDYVKRRLNSNLRSNEQVKFQNYSYNLVLNLKIREKAISSS